MRKIIIENANENNLQFVSLEIPHYQLIAVTGVSGSGKTSLVRDVLCAEGQRLFIENFISSRISPAQPPRPNASRIDGLFPVIAIDQNQVVRNPRSTVGTLTELYDLLRLLFARLAKSEIPGLHPYRSLFSFNLPDGWCPACKGLGLEDHIDPSLLIGDAYKSIREGAFVLTTPKPYIIYSQVTMSVLDEVCRSEGFNIDIPWQELTNEQKNVVLNGSNKIKVLFGKHPLESRLTWTGITAKPRGEDYYRGILPVMEEILRRDRNPNIMRFARSQSCTRCGGKRLNNNALSFKLWGRDLPGFSNLSISQIHAFFSSLSTTGQEALVVNPIREAILRRTQVLMKLGAGHLSLDRDSPSLRSGEAQRIRLANQAASGMRNVMYILDEPSAGLHPSEHRDLLDVLRSLVSTGNTVMLVDHDEQSIREADWIIDIGPGAAAAGGRIIFNGPAVTFFNQPHPESITWKYLIEQKSKVIENKIVGNSWFYAENAVRNNLQDISPAFLVDALNVITGVSGSGKTSLVDDFLENTIRRKTGGTDVFKKVIHLDSSPIGRTPKSNPATYTGLSDHVRDLLASVPESIEKKYKKGQFSFVVKGGRCEACGGAGVQQIGMHFLGNVEVVCDVCEGKRFTDETLQIKYKGLNIFNILELTVDEAHLFFHGQKKIISITEILAELGLGYLKLGQPSTTLSGGEAQRVKLATELSRQANGRTLYILDEPTSGLHMADVETLLKALRKLISKGNTLLCIEHDPAFILQSDWMVDLGPGSASDGGRVVAEGYVNELIGHQKSLTSSELRRFKTRDQSLARTLSRPCTPETIEAPIRLSGVETNNLKNIDVNFPIDAVTVVTGVSGSGKSSLVYGTLYAESQRCFIEGMSSYSRQYQAKTGVATLRESSGLIPAISLQKKNPVKNPRSTIATYTGIYDLYRLLFSRLGKSYSDGIRTLSTAFSFNSDEGACPVCKGLGTLTVCDPDKLLTDPQKPLIAGALDGSKTGKFYADPYGQHVAALQTAGRKAGIDFSIPYIELSSKAKDLAWYGSGDEIFDVDWNYKRGAIEGVHQLKSTWPGFLALVESEYFRKHADARGDAMLPLMKKVECAHCKGYRLKPEILQYQIGGQHIGEVTAWSADEASTWFLESFINSFETQKEKQVATAFLENITGRLNALQKAGLGYISTDRIVGTLSGGEFQRLQLAGLVRAPLTGVAYILDEPSFGLHPRDAERIRDLILNLNQNGNTVIMVDHAPAMIEMSDYLIELGPGAGNDGGMVLFSGRLEDRPAELTDRILEDKVLSESRMSGGFRGEPKMIKTGLPGAESESDGGLMISKAFANNLQNIDVAIAPGMLTVISGVSGSGKTSLLDKVIYESYSAGKPMFCNNIAGFENFNNLIYIDQPLPGKGHSATIGSMLGISDLLSRIFADTPAAKSLGYKASHFLMGSRDSRCPTCEGTGRNQVSMDFFSDVISPCEHCGGTGFRDEVLEVTINGETIYDVLQIPFKKLSALIKTKWPIIELLAKTGLDHLNCGRSLKTLSNGELQRLKLVSGLSSQTGTRTLFLLDEPSGGLHPQDIRKLIKLLVELTNAGNTIVCVTHEPLLISIADRVIELGPGGGSRGGRIVSG